MEMTSPPGEVLTVQTPVKPEKRTLQSPSVSRFTRSRVAPEWTNPEMLVLVNEFAAVNNNDLRILPSCQKWKMISENMADLNVIRSSNQCQRKWESLLTDYSKIKGWESQFGTAAFWRLDNESKMNLGLPAIFDRELFSLMDAFLVVHRSRSVSEVDIGLEKLPKGKAKSFAVAGNPGPPGYEKQARGRKKKGSTSKEKDMAKKLQGGKQTGNSSNAQDRAKELQGRKQTGNISEEQDMAKKLQGSAQLIHALLSRELTKGMCSAGSPDFKSPVDPKIVFVKQQADELIRIFGTLVDNLNQFAELVKGSRE